MKILIRIYQIFSTFSFSGTDAFKWLFVLYYALDVFVEVLHINYGKTMEYLCMRVVKLFLRIKSYKSISNIVLITWYIQPTCFSKLINKAFVVEILLHQNYKSVEFYTTIGLLKRHRYILFQLSENHTKLIFLFHSFYDKTNKKKVSEFITKTESQKFVAILNTNKTFLSFWILSENIKLCFQVNLVG